MAGPVNNPQIINPSDDEIREILSKYKVVAVVGLSDKQESASFRVASFLKTKGYRIVPVNPNHEVVLDEKCYPSLSDIPFKVGIVDVLRRPDAVAAIADEAVRIGAPVLWLQLGVVNIEAAEKHRKDIKVVMDRCMKIEYSRLFGTNTES